MAASENHLVIKDSLERRRHHEPTCCYLAKHRDTIYKDIPINHLIPLAFHVKVTHLKTADLQLLITLVCKKYDNSNLLSDWHKYCKALDPEKRIIATLGMLALFLLLILCSFYEEGALFFAAESLPPSEDRESWKSTCLSGFYLLKHGNDARSKSPDDQSAHGPVSQTQIKPTPAQQEANGIFPHGYPVPPPSKHASTESP